MKEEKGRRANNHEVVSVKCEKSNEKRAKKIGHKDNCEPHFVCDSSNYVNLKRTHFD